MICPKIKTNHYNLVKHCSSVIFSFYPHKTHLDGLVPERGVREIVFIDLIGCGVYVDGRHHLCRYATLWKEKKEIIEIADEHYLNHI